MRTETVKLYTFNELSKETQEKVLESHRQFNVDFDGWWDAVYEGWKEKLAEAGFEEVKIHFSGFWSQGDGACFDCTQFDVVKLATKLGLNPLEIKVLETMELSLSIDTINHHYSHYNTRRASVQSQYDMEDDTREILAATDLPLKISDDLSTEAREFLEFRLKHSDLPAINDPDGLVNEFQAGIEELRADYSKEIYRDLEKEYHDLTADEAVQEALISNDYEFTANGDIW